MQNCEVAKGLMEEGKRKRGEGRWEMGDGRWLLGIRFLIVDKKRTRL